MADERTDVEIALAKEGRLLKKLTRLHEEQTLLYQQNIHDTFYEKALEFESASEKLTLNARTIPVATGRPSAQMDVELIMEKEIPVEMGFTEQGWFQLRMPMLLPQKGKGGSQYIRGFLYPAMMRFMRNDQRALRYKECILIYRHIYSRTYDERKYRDHDNIELNMVTDTVAVRVMADDSPKSVPVGELALSVRANNCLQRNKVESVADLAQLKDKDLLAMNNLGKAALQDIRQKQSEFIENLLTEVVTEEIERISIGNIDSDAQGGTA